MTFTATPIKYQALYLHTSREKQWLAENSDGFWTLAEIAAKYRCSKAKIDGGGLLPQFEKRSPYGHKTRLWRISDVTRCLGE